MSICGSCRRAAVTSKEPGHVGVWQGGPLLDISILNIFTGGGWDVIIHAFAYGQIDLFNSAFASATSDLYLAGC